MKKGILTRALALVCTLVPAWQACASSDESVCIWGSEQCLPLTPPILDIDSDTRDNLLHLLTASMSLPDTPLTLSRTRQPGYRSYSEYVTAPVTAAAAETARSISSEQRDKLGITSESSQAARDESGLEDRFVSLTAASDENFFFALLNEPALTPEQRHSLAVTRLALSDSEDAQRAIDELEFPEHAVAQQFRRYLSAARHFYYGDYDTAEMLFSDLASGEQPWLAETASYMLMRTALNKSTRHAVSTYGSFDVEKIAVQDATQARERAENYLLKWPEGQYADSTRGLLRRINWYLQDTSALAVLYEREFTQAENLHTLLDLIAESDQKLLSEHIRSNKTPFLSAPDAPLMTFIQTLRLMRNSLCKEETLCIDENYLQGLHPLFAAHNMLVHWQYLQNMHTWSKGEYQRLIEEITPRSSLPEKDILTFSTQALYGNALMALKRWPEAIKHWSQLLRSSQPRDQQLYLQGQLAAALIQADRTADIFALHSPVTSLRYRSAVLKTKASPALLRQQVSEGVNNEERTIALHTLLIRDLLNGRYADWLKDRELASYITQPVISEAFADVDLSHFDWRGENTEAGYMCRSLQTIVQDLNHNPHNGHALNCLAEFFRATNIRIDIAEEGQNANALDVAIDISGFNGRPNRETYYQQVITEDNAEPEDKAYALYRAINCYAPSGYNDCGGEDQPQLKRKGWFVQLKTQYPGSPWAQRLKYYW